MVALVRTGGHRSAPNRGPTIVTSCCGASSRASSSARPVALSDRSKARIEILIPNLQGPGDVRAGVAFHDEPPTAEAELVAERRIAEQARERVGQRAGITRVDEQYVITV